MKTTFLFIVYCLMFTFYCSYAQVPADSLPGTYAGQYWYANPASSPWVISPDTFYVQNNIDSLNCKIDAYCSHFSVGFGSASGGYFTDYFSCNTTAPINNYIKFYNGDSVRVIVNNYPQPYPNPPLSFRFYGKRISSIISEIRELAYSKQMNIYPNPANEKLFVSIESGKINLSLYNSCGVLVLNSVKSEIDVSILPLGIYFAKLKRNDKISYQKIVIQH